MNNQKKLNLSHKGVMSFLLFIFYLTPLYAGTYYVSPSGNATWVQAQNISTPSTISNAMANAVAGDVIYFRGGTYSYSGPVAAPYHATFEPLNSGTISNPITFQAYNGEKPIILITYTSGTNGFGIGTGGKNYIIWDGFTISATGGKTAGIMIGSDTWSTGVIIQNCSVEAGATPLPNTDNYDICRMEDTHYATVRNNKIGKLTITGGYSDNNAALKLYHNDYATIENNEFYDSPNGICSKSYINNSVIRNNYFHGCTTSIRFNLYFASHSYDSNSNSIFNNVISQTSSNTPIYAAADSSDIALLNDLRIYNNTIRAVSADGICLHRAVRLVAYNNISLSKNSSTFMTVRNESTLSEEDHNQWGVSSFSIVLRYYGTSVATYTTFASWLASGALIGGGNPGSGDLRSDPLFVNGSGNYSVLSDFALAVNSPCKGAGRNGSDMGANVSLVGINSNNQNLPSDTSPPSSPSGVTIQIL